MDIRGCVNRNRHGTLSLYAALNVRTGESSADRPRHTSDAFVDFLTDIVDTQSRRREIHVIVDNLSAHKTKKVEAFLQAHPQVHLHFTPTYSSWLNQVELWFAKIERDLLARGIFTSVPDLARKIRRYITVTTKTRNRSVGPTAIRRIELLLIQLIRSTSGAVARRFRSGFQVRLCARDLRRASTWAQALISFGLGSRVIFTDILEFRARVLILRR